MEKTELQVDGMSCAHCEKSVKTAISAINGVKSVTVSLAEKIVTVEHDPSVTRAAIAACIDDQGYSVAD